MSVDWPLVMRMIKELRQEVRSLRARFNDEDAEEESSVDEPVMESAPDSPFMGTLQYVVIVTSVDAANRIVYGQRALPTTDASTFWVADPGNTSILSAKLPATASVPAVGDTTLLTFTGLTDTGASYGIFGAGGGAGKQVRLKSVQNDYVTCRELDADETEGTEDILVAKPYKLRTTPFNGATVNGITYVYSTNFLARTATNTTGSVQVHRIVPAYRPDEDILYILAVTTNVASASYVDLNADGRGWATL